MGGQQRVVVKLGGEEGVHQSAESHPITPAGREVLDVNVLPRNREEGHLDDDAASVYVCVSSGVTPVRLCAWKTAVKT